MVGTPADCIGEIIVPSGCETITDRFHGIGNPDLVNRHKIGLLCSIQCPGDIILKTLDLVTSIRDADCCVVSGFHSPMEQECLKVLLKGSCGLIVCPARSLVGMQIPSGYRQPLESGRLLLMSAFSDTCNRNTRESAKERNRMVAAISDVVLVPYASPSGSIEALCHELKDHNLNVVTLSSGHSADSLLIGLGEQRPRRIILGDGGVRE